MDYELIVKNLLKEQIVNKELISQTNNKVFKVVTKDEGILYVKFYEGTSTHIDNELKVYDLVDNKYLKDLYYKSFNPKVAIFKELAGKTIDELTSQELEDNSDKIIDNLCEYFNSISNNKIKNYGLLDEKLDGRYNDFFEFLNERQNCTSLILKEYKDLSCIYNLIINKYKDIIVPDNSLVPIDTNLKNIMLMEDSTIKFIDPGEMISGPIMMAYGDFVAHSYKTILYDKLIERLRLNNDEEKLLRIYAILSSLNILSFLKKNGVDDLYKVIPYGNKYTFFELIKEHLEYLDLS